ncbi:MAG: hypothetical protein FJ119_03095 [Deltaproteobacteria bacterium]|nr:hypothetical protein [Deltaproteobacteria bacterium]
MIQKILMVLFLNFIVSCSMGYEYHIVINNIGKKTITDANVYYGDFSSVGGVLPPGVNAGHMFVDCPIPDIATVRWKTDDGLLHEERVEFNKNISKNFKGEIWFNIDDENTVKVHFKKETK